MQKIDNIITMGGKDFNFSGWMEHEINKRAGKSSENKYPGKKTISNEEIIEDVVRSYKVGNKLPPPLIAACGQLSAKFKIIENNILTNTFAGLPQSEIIVLPVKTANDLADFAYYYAIYNIEEHLYDIKSFLLNIGETINATEILADHKLPYIIKIKRVKTRHDEDVAALEEEVVEYLNELEKIHTKCVREFNTLSELIA